MVIVGDKLMASQRYKIVLLQVPPSLNRWQRLHWAERRSIKEGWEKEIWAMSRCVPTNNQHIDLTANIVFGTERKRDLDNYASVLWKLTQDAFVNLHFIPDDTPKYITVALPELVIEKGCIEHTELILTIT